MAATFITAPGGHIPGNADTSITLNEIGGAIIRPTGGCITSVTVISQAGSSDCEIQFFDGSDNSGRLIATILGGAIGVTGATQGQAFSSLYVEMTGTTPAVATFCYV